MPIGDLLAQITGDKATPPAKATPPQLKRKADDSLRDPRAKTPRTAPSTSAPARSNSDAKSARPDHRIDPVTTPSSTKPATSSVSRSLPAKTSNGVSNRSTTTSSRPATSARPAPNAARPGAATNGGDGGPKVPPKKGSFAEIMARAQVAQASMANAGKIQHKPLERGPTKRERQEMKAEQAKGVRKTGRIAKSPAARITGYTGSARPGANGIRDRNGNGPADPRRPANGKAVPASKGRAASVEEKKPKKAAVATTGYTGTARPKPGAGQKTDSPSAAPANGSSRDRAAGMPFGASRRSRRHDEYDDELDDFIEYDDDEPSEQPVGHGRRYLYAEEDEEDESDMEAGIDDIDDEEYKSGYYARREDQEQEALEAKLKREKEARRRDYLNRNRR